jgi:hypothetical protein
MTVVNTNTATRAGLLLSYYLVLSFWAAQTLSMTLITRNIAGQTKKTVVVAANFIAWASGNAAGSYPFLSSPFLRIYPFSLHISIPTSNYKQLTTSPLSPGPQVFLSWDAPRYFIAFSTHMGCYVLLVIVLIFQRWYLMSQNKKKDRLQAELAASGTEGVVDAQMVHAFDDLTDKENLNFRYVY